MSRASSPARESAHPTEHEPADRVQLARQGRRRLRERLLYRKRGIPLKVLMVAIAAGTLIFAVTERSTRQVRLQTNERRIVGLLGKITRYQELFRDAGVQDQDSNGRGEYGFLQQLGGLEPIPGRLIAGGIWQPGQNRGEMYELALNVREGEGIARRFGYRFTLYLHDAEGGTRESSPLPTLAADPDSVRARERRWSVYAWPERWNETGRHTYVVTEEGAILRTDAAHAIEGDQAPPADAHRPSARRTLASPTATSPEEGPGRHEWMLVERPALW